MPLLHQVKQILDLCHFQYREYKLDEHFDRHAFQEEFGGDSTFPQVLLNNKKLGGCTDTVKYLKEHNLLDGSRRHAS
jgi:glutaredoxin